MSLERTALRLAATMALANGFEAPWPTMAQNRVFDSRQDPIQGIKVGEIVPTLILYTDEDNGEELSKNNGGPPFIHTCHLVIELSLGIAKAYRPEGAAEDLLTLVPPQTEPELECALDAFEAQVSRIFRDLQGPWGALLGTTINRIEMWQSHRFVEHETNVRLASRQITARVRLQLESEPLVQASAPAAAYIPEPLAAVLQQIIASGSPYVPTAQAMHDLLLANAAPQPIIAPSLNHVRFVESETAGARPLGVADADLT